MLPQALISMRWLETELRADRFDRLSESLLPFNLGHPDRLLRNLSTFPDKWSYIELGHLAEILPLGNPHDKADAAIWCLGLHEGQQAQFTHRIPPVARHDMLQVMDIPQSVGQPDLVLGKAAVNFFAFTGLTGRDQAIC